MAQLPEAVHPIVRASIKRERQEEKAQAKAFLRLHVRKILGSEAENIRIKYDLEDAHPVDAILSSAQRHKAELIVMGTHGRGGATRVWLGSVLENVIRQTRIPVFAVRQKQHEFIDPAKPQNVPRLKTIVCPVNFTQVSKISLKLAVSLAQQFNARLIPACIIEAGAKRTDNETEQDLSTFVQQSGAAECDFVSKIRKGDAGKEIVSMASRAKADLIVMGAQPRNPMQTWLWGDTTEFVLRHAPVPVLVVPAAQKT